MDAGSGVERRKRGAFFEELRRRDVGGEERIGSGSWSSGLESSSCEDEDRRRRLTFRREVLCSSDSSNCRS